VELGRIGLVPSQLEKRTTYKATDTQVDVLMPAYYQYVESGRRKGAKMPPQGPILEWMKRERIAPGRENEVVYAIRKSIAINGILPRPFLLRAIKTAGVSRIPQIFRIEVEGIAQDYTGTIKTTLEK
jgi:hypothetical protein